jgi:hypothetical protein
LGVKNTASLEKAYLEALDARPVVVRALQDGLTDLSHCPDRFAVDAIWFRKPHHAELVLMQCLGDLQIIGAVKPCGGIELSTITVRDYVIDTAALLGANWLTTDEMGQAVKAAVATIVDEVELARQTGGLAQVNAAYKVYRSSQLAKGEKASPYSVYLTEFTRSLVTLAARNANAN